MMSGPSQPMSARQMFLRHRRAGRFRGVAATVCTLSLIGTPAALAADNDGDTGDAVKKRQAYQRQTDDQAKQEALQGDQGGTADQQQDRVSGQQKTGQQKDRLTGQQSGPQNDRMSSQQGDQQRLSARLLETEQLIGSTVYDAANRDQEVGTLDEIVFDRRTGEVKYGVLASGGVLGFGEKLFAVPWSAFDFAATTQDEGPRIYAPVTSQKLEEADGFDKDNWPDMANEKWSKQTHERWGQTDQRRGDQQMHRQGAARLGDARQDDDRRDKAMQARTDKAGGDAVAQRERRGELLRCSTLIGRDVDNNAEQSIGEVRQLLVTDREGRIAYAVIEVGDYLDSDQNHVAVPWGALNAQTARGEDEEFQITLDADKQKLQSVAYAEDNQPQMDSTWARKVHRTFNQDADMAVLGYTDGSRQGRDQMQADGQKQRTSFSGKIQSIDTFQPDDASAEGIKLTIQTAEGETRELHVGSKEQMSAQQINLKEGARVTGSGHQPQGEAFIVVDRLTVNGQTVQLRDKSDKNDNRAIEQPVQPDRATNPEGGRSAE